MRGLVKHALLALGEHCSPRDVALLFQEAFGLPLGKANVVAAGFRQIECEMRAGTGTMVLIPELVRTYKDWSRESPESGQDSWLGRIAGELTEARDADPNDLNRLISREGIAGLSTDDQESIRRIIRSLDARTDDLLVISSLAERLQSKLLQQS